MAQVQKAITNSQSADWREDCVKPAKDSRVQTEVDMRQIFSSLSL